MWLQALWISLVWTFTQNRTAFPAIIAGAIIYLFTTIKNWKAFWLSIGVFAIGLSFLFSSDLGVRMGTLDSSMEERISIWDAGMALFKQNPFWGEWAIDLYALLS